MSKPGMAAQEVVNRSGPIWRGLFLKGFERPGWALDTAGDSA